MKRSLCLLPRNLRLRSNILGEDPARGAQASARAYWAPEGVSIRDLGSGIHWYGTPNCFQEKESRDKNLSAHPDARKG